MRVRTLALASAWWLAACSPEPPEQQAEPPSEPQPAPKVEPAPTPEPVDEAEDPDDTVIEIESPQTRRDPNLLQIKSVSPTPATVRWREIQTLSEPLELVPVASGVVARSSSGVYELDKGQLVLRPELTLPEATLLGHWPKDVWYAEATPVEPDADGRPTFEFRVHRLDRERRWVAQETKHKPTWRGQSVRKGWYAGVLVREGGMLTRLGSRTPAPKIGMRMGKIVLDTIETASGRLYNMSQRPNGAYVQETCFSQSCVDEHAKRMPPGGEWSFALQVPRQRHSVSVVATLTYHKSSTHHLLHFEAGGWSLEALPKLPSGMWPADDGGLWILVGGELRYRTAKGHWFAIALPEGAGKISVAISSDLRELWIAAKSSDRTVVYATEAIGVPTPG